MEYDPTQQAQAFKLCSNYEILKFKMTQMKSVQQQHKKKKKDK